MAKELVYIDRAELTSAADAIRSKLGTTVTYTVSQFGDAINSIQSGTELVTPSINVSPGGLITAMANGQSATQQLPVQAATSITPTKSTQTAVAAGKYTTGVVTVNPIPGEYIIPSGSQTLTQNGTYNVTNLSSVTVNVTGGGTTPTGSINISTNGSHDVTSYATANVSVPPLIYTSSKTGGNSTSITFSGLPAEPVAWSLCSNTATTTTTGQYNIVNAYYNGSSYSGLTIYESSRYSASRTNKPTISATYSGGTLTITATGSNTSSGIFNNGITYHLIAVCQNQGGTDVIMLDSNSDEPIDDQETYIN